MTVGLVGSEETRWGRWRWWWSSLTRKQAKKQPIALETDLSRNPTTDLHTNPNSNSRFHNQHTIDFLIITHYYYLPMSCLLSSTPFLFSIFLFFSPYILLDFYYSSHNKRMREQKILAWERERELLGRFWNLN